MQQLVVLKFGGTSVGESDARRRVLTIIQAETRPRVVVVSALSGVTDALLRVAGAEDAPSARLELGSLLERHLEAVRMLRDAGARGTLEQELRRDMADVSGALEGSRGAADGAARDVVVAAGELWSSRLLTALLNDAGTAAEWIDAREVLRTDGEHGTAFPDLDATGRAAARLVVPVVASGRVAVLGGFIGSNVSGRTTTLGRGGSDYSAAVFAACMEAAEIQIWTDVDGVLTADPRILPQARVVPHLSYGEAHDLASFGAKVLHPGTIAPAVDRGIPVLVRNSHRPASPGTRVTARERVAATGRIAGLACRTGMALAEVIWRPGVDKAALSVHLIEALGAAGLEGALVDHREDRSAVAFEQGPSIGPSGAHAGLSPRERLQAALAGVADIWFREGLATVTIVGEGLATDGAVAAAVASALREVAVYISARPAGGRSIAVVVDAALASAVMARLHDCFFAAETEGSLASRDVVRA